MEKTETVILLDVISGMTPKQMYACHDVIVAAVTSAYRFMTADYSAGSRMTEEGIKKQADQNICRFCHGSRLHTCTGYDCRPAAEAAEDYCKNKKQVGEHDHGNIKTAVDTS